MRDSTLASLALCTMNATIVTTLQAFAAALQGRSCAVRAHGSTIADRVTCQGSSMLEVRAPAAAASLPSHAYLWEAQAASMSVYNAGMPAQEQA